MTTAAVVEGEAQLDLDLVPWHPVMRTAGTSSVELRGLARVGTGDGAFARASERRSGRVWWGVPGTHDRLRTRYERTVEGRPRGREPV